MADPVLSTLSLSAGVGWLDAGWAAGLAATAGFRARTACFAEWESYAASVLLARMESQELDAAPVWCGDIGDLNVAGCVPRVDGVVVGFPCQPWSFAGTRKGKDDDRWIWPSIAETVKQSGPGVVFLENVPGLLRNDGLASVLRDLARLGFDAVWDTFSAKEVGASHLRKRVFVLGYSPGWAQQFRDLRSDWLGRHGAGLAHAECQPVRAEQLDSAGERRGTPAADKPVPGTAGGRLGDSKHSAAGNGAAGPEGRAPSGERRRLQRSADGGGILVNADGSGRRPQGDSGDSLLVDTGSGEMGDTTGDGRQPRRAQSDWRGIVGGNGQLGNARSDGQQAGDDTALRITDCPSVADSQSRCGRVALAGGEGLEGHERPPQFAPGPGLGGFGVVDRLVELLRKDPAKAWRVYQAERANTVRWAHILHRWPHLAPSVESDVRVLADGRAMVVDQSRADQLRCAGNGVVWLQAAIAAATLLTRMAEGESA